MTKQKQLKRLVRQRMEKTGERYAAARRHVVGAIAPPERSAGPERFHRPGSVPATTALRVLWAASGVEEALGTPLDEPLALVVAGGVGAGMFAFHYEEACVSTFFVAGRHLWQDDLGYLVRACERAGLAPRVAETGGAAKARRELDQALAAGRPAVAWVDHAHLPHRAAPASWSGGGYHVVPVYRADEESVCYGDLTDAPIECSREAFETARARIAKQKNRVLTLEPAGRVPAPPKLVRGGLAACVEGLTKARMKNFTLRSFHDWADALSGSTAKSGWQRVFPRGRALWQALTSVHDFVEHYGTGGGLVRPLFAEGLGRVAEILGDDPWRALAERYAALGRGWSDLADAALPDDVPLLRRAKELAAERSELVAAGEPAGPERIRAIWTELARLGDEAAADFPLDEARCEALRADLQARLRVLCDGEEAALAALRAAL